MLISHDLGFLFIHIPKTAGCSVLDALSPLTCPMPTAKWRRRLIWIGRVNRIGTLYKSAEFPVHVAAATVRRCLPANIYNRLFKFAFIRNPWDAMVSQYVYIRDIGHHHLSPIVAKMSGFEEFVEWDLSRHNRTQHRYVTDQRGRLLIDFLGRFETVNDDFAQICRQLRIEVALPHENKSDRRDYREYYNDRTRALVARHFARDIALFGYAFDPVRSRARTAYHRLVPYRVWQDAPTSSPATNLPNPAQFLRYDASILKQDAATTVGTDGTITVKKFHRRNLLDPIKSLFRRSKAERACHTGSMLASVFIPTPEVLGATQQRCCGLQTASYLITRHMPNTVTLPDWTGDLAVVAPRLGEILARLHNAGFTHRDLKPTNIIVDPFGNISLVDLDGVRFRGTVPDPVTAKNLARLLRAPGKIGRLQPAHIRMFLRHYCRARGISPARLLRTAYPAALRGDNRRKIGLYTVIAFLALAVSVGVWNQWIKYRIIPKRWGIVQSGAIYRSGQLHPALIERVLRANQIQVIVDLTTDRNPDAFQLAEANAAKRLGIEHCHYPLKGDGTGDIRHYAAAIARIHQATLSNQPVLVHCAAGSQRTGGIIASYRLFVEHASPQDVIKEMEQYDWDPEKNRVLIEYLNTQLPTLARLLTENGVISEPPAPLPYLVP